MAARWKAKPKGFVTVQQTIDGKKWWVRPDGSAVPRPGTPEGGRARPTTRSGVRNSLIPRDWVGSEGLIGNWGKQPRLDPTKWETMESPETGRWWARPRTELTGLSDQDRAEVRGYDQQTAAGASQIGGAFDAFVRESQANANAGMTSLTGLASLMGIGANRNDPTGQVVSDAARTSVAASTAPTVAALARTPTLARDAGVTAGQRWTTERQAGRQQAIRGMRQSQAEAEVASLDRATELRGQELEALGRAAGLQTDLDIAGIRADSDAADRDAQVAMNDADNATSQRNTDARIRAEEAKAARKAGRKPPSASDIRQWAKRARQMWDGIPRTVTEDYTDSEGNAKTRQRTEYLQYSPNEIIREMIAMGATRKRAVRIVRQITGQVNIGNPNAPVPSAGQARGWFR